MTESVEDESSRQIVRRTVKFFRLRAATDASVTDVPLDGVDWASLIQDYGSRDYTKRKYTYGGNTYVFERRDTGDRHFALHRLKRESDFLSQISPIGDVQEIMAVDEERSFADTTAGVFLSDQAIFAIVAGNMAAPRASAVARWLTDTNLFQQRLIFEAVPLVTRPQIERLYQNDGARKVRVSVPVAQLRSDPEEQGSALGGLLRELAGRVPDSRLEVTISYGNRRPPHGSREALIELAQDLSRSLGVGAQAEASVLHEVEGRTAGTKKLMSEVVDIVQHEIAETFNLRLVNGGVMIDATLTAIDYWIEQVAGDLERAWEVDLVSTDGPPDGLVDRPPEG